MIVTNEMEKQFRSSKGGVPPKSLALIRKLFGTKKFNSIIGKEISQDVYDELMQLKSDCLKRKASRKKAKHETKVYTKPTTIKPCTITTGQFIKDYIENESDSNIHGGLVPQWIHAPVSWDIIRIKLMQLDYKDFLKTYYWKAIRLYMIHKNGGHCTFCNHETRLNVHHRTYDHHGLELFFLDDLVVLCESCHAKEHGIKMLNTNNNTKW